MNLAKRFLKHRWQTLFLILILLVATGTVFARYRAKVNVQTIRPMRGPIVEAVYGLGTVAATRTYDLKLGVTNRVERLFVTEGQKVEKGAKLLAMLDGGVQRAPFAATVTALPFKVGETIFP